MKAIILMFDSLNRQYLPPYGNTWVHAPNFKRLAERAVTFDSSYVCSMPCMPARRDMHTGRPNFLHRGWGPIEPFDESFPKLLGQAGIHTHLTTDHYHYWHNGGATYHTQYSTHEFFRGQEGDFWIPRVGKPDIPENINKKGSPNDWINRAHMKANHYHSQSVTVDAGLSFLNHNATEDNWLLQIECFDPHEPFYCEQQYRDLYPKNPKVPLFDWPGYGRVTESEDEITEARHNYAALLSQCDASLGKVLDTMDTHQLWEDTMLIVCTDHGFLLGEHGWWAKNIPPLYDEIAHTPFFVWDPRSGKRGERCSALVQPAIDLAPTLLSYFGQNIPSSMTGKDLAPAIMSDTPVRESAIFGYFGDRVNITDGRYVYLRSPQNDNQPLYSYTLMPTVFRSFYALKKLQGAELSHEFSFTKGCPLLRMADSVSLSEYGPSLLFDLQHDPHQEHPITDPAVEARLTAQMAQLMREVEAPAEQYQRMGLDA